MKVTGAGLDNGLLHVDVARNVPDAAKPRTIKIGAKAFYGTIAVATLIGVFNNFVGIDPIKALFWAAVLNGVWQCR